MTMLTITLHPAEPHRAAEYGLLMESDTQHDVVGPYVHNRNHRHSIQVWENRNGTDPSGRPATEPYSYRLSAQPTVIDLGQVKRDPVGPTLNVLDVVQLSIHGFVLGEFLIVSRDYADPILEPVDR